MENPDYLSQQLITYLGNKRALLDFVSKGLRRVLTRLGQTKISTFDVFSGSGVVARYLKQFSSRLIANDLERYSQIINLCYLANPSELPLAELRDLHRRFSEDLATKPPREGFVQRLYAPSDDTAIQRGERVFYTARNARYLDTARQWISELAPHLQPYLLGPLLSQASIHANTAGVFKGFYKDSGTGRGKFGGRKGDALSRILAPIEVPFPLFSSFECPFEVYREDANALVRRIGGVDLAYLDPPYNQHPYGSNYFMLNLLADYQEPTEISLVSGIPAGWNRSSYNRKAWALDSLGDLVENLNARFLMISFNSEGFIPQAQMEALLRHHGALEVLQTRYNTFRGSRNLRGRNLHVREYLYLLEKS